MGGVAVVIAEGGKAEPVVVMATIKAEEHSNNNTTPKMDPIVTKRTKINNYVTYTCLNF